VYLHLSIAWKDAHLSTFSPKDEQVKCRLCRKTRGEGAAMRGVKQMPPLVCLPLPLLLQLLRDMETAYSKVSRRDARWMISPLGHIYYPNLGTVRARAHVSVWPTFTANCPTDRPPPFFFACRSNDRVQSNNISPHTIPFPPLFSPSSVSRAEYDT